MLRMHKEITSFVQPGFFVCGFFFCFKNNPPILYFSCYNLSFRWRQTLLQTEPSELGQPFGSASLQAKLRAVALHIFFQYTDLCPPSFEKLTAGY